jgi:ribosomal protein S18 acetylase RimI-like enzyme
MDVTDERATLAERTAEAHADAARIEEAALNALQTQQQRFYDGWILRLSPGKAKRGRSVNPHFGSSLPLATKIAYCERIYAAHRLPTLFRITPFTQPAELDETLERRGYRRFDDTLVQTLDLARSRRVPIGPDVALASVPVAEFAAVVAALRGSSDEQRRAHVERLTLSPLALHALVARIDGGAVACGQLACDDDIAAIYDMVTAPAWRGRGIASAVVDALLAHARSRGARVAFLQVNDDNAPALAVYAKFGFATAYRYHYRARDGECQ